MNGIIFLKESKGTYRGGIEGKILSIASELGKRKILFPVLVTTDSSSLFVNEFKELGYPVYTIDMYKLYNFKEINEKIDFIVRKHNVLIVQSHAFRESFVGRIYKRHNHSILHIFRVHTHIEGNKINGLKKLFYYSIDFLTSFWIDIYVPISNKVKTELRTKSFIRAKKIKVVYNGIDVLGLPDKLSDSIDFLPRDIAIIGEIEQRKNQELGLLAINELNKKGIQINLHLIGRPNIEYKNKLENIIAKFNLSSQVFFYGIQPNKKIYELIKTVPVIVLPSFFEGVPTSIIEGMSLKKIVITTSVGGSAELVKDGINGYLHRPNDVNLFSELLENIFTSPSKNFNQIRENGFNTFQSQFSIESMMKGLESIYGNLSKKNILVQ